MRPGRTALVALALALAAGSCKSEKRDKALGQLRARTSAERTRALREIAAVAGKDGETWSAVSRLARDPSREVRAAVASVLGSAPRASELPPALEGGPADPDDVLGGLLSDPQDEVRRAAASSLGQRCGARGKGYLLSAFTRSGTAVRAAVVEALGHCNDAPVLALRHEERSRRERALRLLDAPSAAQRARGARELGLLGRDGDVKTILPLLDDRDGVVAAAAARALGEAGAAQVEPRLRAMLAEDATVVVEAATEGLAALGPEALRSARAELERVLPRGDEAADSAAAALVSIAASPKERDGLCTAALTTSRAAAAALLARGGHCQGASFLTALAPPRVSAMLAGALAGSDRPVDAPRPATALIAVLERGAPDEQALAARVAQRLSVARAGPALVALVRHERKTIEAERAAPPLDTAETEVPAAEAAEMIKRSQQGPKADRARYQALMRKLATRGKSQDARAGAELRLGDLLKGGVSGRRRDVLSAALRAAVALGAPGAAAEATALAADRDPDVAAAARGASEADPPPLLFEACAKNPASPSCLVIQAAEGGQRSPMAEAAARQVLYSDDGAERAAACAVLRAAGEAALFKPLEQDSERRVRVACASTSGGNETAPQKGR